MKTLFSLFLLARLASAAELFPEGSFAGTGVKTFDDGTTKNYQVAMKSAGNQLDFTYEFPEKAPIHFSLKLTFDKSGFFKIGDIGEGYCAKTSCHYSVKLGPNVVEQWTYFFQGNDLFKTGSLRTENKSNYWEERLQRE